MVRKQYITTIEVKQMTTIEKNIDDAILNPLIFKAQDYYIQRVFGSDYHQYLQQALTDDNLTADEVTLIDFYIKPALAEWVHYIAITQIANKTTSKSISNEFSQYSINAERASQNDLKNEIRDMAEAYTNSLERYMCLNNDLYPQWENPSDKETQRRNNNSYFNGVYINRRRPIDKYSQWSR